MRFYKPSEKPPSPAQTGLEPMSRRQFAISVGGATLCAPLATAEQPGGEATESRPDDLSLQEWAEVQARYQNMVRMHGSGLSTAERKMLIRVLITNQHMLTSVRSYTVQNGDPSACTLRLRTPEGSTV